jgi:hypothetical protein
MKNNLVFNNYPHYLNFLRKLVVLPSVFTNTTNIKTVLLFCKKIFEKNLNKYNIYFDKEHNLIAVPDDINYQENIIYLSAHVDTVGADIAEWDAPFHPWKLHEDEKEMVARGVSDCKAGVAYQLFLSFLAKHYSLNLINTIFIITFKEEGAGKKTSIKIAKNIGKNLPISKKSTYLLVLENNVKIANKPTLCIYTSERGSYIIGITDFIPELQKYLKNLPSWNPIVISPKIKIDNDWSTTKQNGGHVCSVDRKDNLLTKIILNAQKNFIIKAGKENNFATIPTKILTTSTDKPIKHTLILSNRSFDSLAEIQNQLKGVEFSQIKDFSISQGFNIEKKFLKNNISTVIDNCINDNIDIEYTYNIGASDAGIIYNSIDDNLRKNFYPIIFGPGSRSQRNINPQRLTHGKNETFDKEAGKQAIIFISDFLQRLGHIQ